MNDLDTKVITLRALSNLIDKILSYKPNLVMINRKYLLERMISAINLSHLDILVIDKILPTKFYYGQD